MDKFERALNYLTTTLDAQVFDELKSLVSDHDLVVLEELIGKTHQYVQQTIESLQSKKKWEEHGRLY